MELSDFIFGLNQERNMYNGHFQTELNAINYEDLKELLFAIYSNKENNCKLFLDIYCEKCSMLDTQYISLSIYQKNYWDKGENIYLPEEENRLLISFSSVLFPETIQENDCIKVFKLHLDNMSYIDFKINF